MRDLRGRRPTRELPYLARSARRRTGVEIGSIDGVDVAIVAVEVHDDGWSTIAYMGIVPEARGRGLGRWVHRRGFDRMRALGGTEYHGGTRADNRPMLSLFETHGCSVLLRMTEWVWRGER